MYIYIIWIDVDPDVKMILYIGLDMFQKMNHFTEIVKERAEFKYILIHFVWIHVSLFSGT